MNTKTKLLWLALCAASLGGGLNARAEQNPISYNQTIAPLLQDKCAACHNHATRKGELNLESYEALLNGGKRGPALIPGKSAESLLVKMLEGSVKPRMPLGDQLSPAEINAIKTWIDAGAPGPKSGSGNPAMNANLSAGSASLPSIKPSVPVNPAISALAFQAQGELIALGRYQTVELVNAKTGARVAQLTGHANQVRAVAFSSDGQWLAAAGGNPAQFGEIKLWQVATQKEARTIRGHRDNVFALAFSPDGKLLATCSYDRLLKLWDVATGAEIKTLKDHTDAVFDVAFSPDGKRLASASADRTVKVWDVASGQRLYTFSDALDSVNAIAFSPNGKWLAGAGADRIIHLWELGETEGKQIKSLIAHEDAINQISFSPDGKLLATAGADNQLKLWDAAKLEEVHALEKQADWVFALAFSPDGKRLAVGRHDGSLTFYDSLTGKKLPSKELSAGRSR